MAIKLAVKALEAAIREAKAGGGDVLRTFEGGSGLALRVRDGETAYYFAYRLRGRKQKVKIADVGTIPLVGVSDPPEKRGALEWAKHYASIHLAGTAPAESKREARARRLTFGEVVELYLDDFAKRIESGKRRGRRSTLAEFRRTAGTLILPALGKVEADRLDLQRVARWHAGLADTPASGNRAATLARAAFRFALRQGLILAADPFAALVRFEERGKRERYSLAELERVGTSLREAEARGEVSAPVALAFRFLALTGCRRSELLVHPDKNRRSEEDALRWGDVDLEGGALHLRRAKAGSRDVILSTAALELLRAARPEAPDPKAPVCAGRRGSALTRFEKSLASVFDSAGVAWKGCHALRRTFASVAGDQGLGEYLVAGLLGHGARNVTSAYVIPGVDPLRAAADRVAGEISAALDGRRAKVVDFERSRQVNGGA